MPRRPAIATTAGWRHVDMRKPAGARLGALPYTFHILLETALRAGAEADAAAILRWPDTGAEIAFAPRRVLMRDTTVVPALVDLAAMRDRAAAMGADPGALDLLCPVAVSVDHSLAADRFGTANAMAWNVAPELARNRERHEFLKWANAAFARLTVFPPGMGISHIINLEHPATVAAKIDHEGAPLAIPDTMIGADSHTAMIGALGALGWGVGGLEAESAMPGHPMPLKLPEVVGVRLTGALPHGVLATDLALHVTAELRAMGAVGSFVEFHGPGLAGLSVGMRAAAANMAPEYGATIGFFSVDEATLRYLALTGRPPADVARVGALARGIGLWHDPDRAPDYSREREVDLSALPAIVAGPRRPQDRAPLGSLGAVPGARSMGVPPGAVAMAASTSCTNAGDLGMLVSAVLVAVARGLRVAPWVKSSFAPGSTAMLGALARGRLKGWLDALGFQPVGIGCTPCIGNSGPLATGMEAALAAAPDLPRMAILSGNRNFPGRVHPQVQDAYLASPRLVVAFALAGRLIDLTRDPLGAGADGAPAMLADLWPTAEALEAATLRAAHPADTLAAYADLSGGLGWQAIAAPRGACCPPDDASTYLRAPDFVHGHARAWRGAMTLASLAVYGDDVTADHISPAGAIPAGSAAAAHLTSRGEAAGDLNVCASRRGNYQVMERGAFTVPASVHLMCPGAAPGSTRLASHGPDLPLRDAARALTDAGTGAAIVAGARYGQGSSRDWAAKAPALLRVRAILALGFERIHCANLIAMGVAPIQTPPDWAPATLAITPDDRIEINLTDLPSPGQPVPLRLIAARGTLHGIGRLICATGREIKILLAGGMISAKLSRLGAPTKATA
jgi:aconitate hydratase